MNIFTPLTKRLRFLALVSCVAAPWMAGWAQTPDPAIRFGGQIPTDVDAIYRRGLAWLAKNQTDEGSWKSGQSGPGVDGICLMAFLASGDDPNFGRYAGVIRKALRSIVSQQDANGYIPNSMYHHGFAMLALSEAYGVVDESLLWEGAKGKKRIAETLKLAIQCAVTSQKNNEWKAWRYSPESTDADTSVTGAILMGLLAARNAGIQVPDEAVNGALEYMKRSTGADGSVAYSGGFGGGGSTNLTAISALVSAVSKTKQADHYKAAVQFLKDNLEREMGTYHKEYGRYYTAQALFQADYEAWRKWNESMVRTLREEQSPDGSFSDAYQTGMALLSLAVNYRFLPIYER